MQTNLHPLAQVREVLGKSQQVFATDLALSTRTVSAVEAHTYSATPWSLIDALSKHFALSLDTARAICDASITEADLAHVLRALRAKGGKR